MWGRRRTTRRRILRCPHCHSDRLILEGALILGQKYRGLDCDYVGSLVVETEEPVPRAPDPD